jgi:NAD(P)-dependent dehydrogenase (short-subunit alcohol dehydrogenase family)
MKTSDRNRLLALAGLGLLVGLRMILRDPVRYDLRGRVAIITGGARGLGLMIARHLAAKGAKLVICSRSQDQLETAKQSLKALGADVLALQCDVTDQSQVIKLVAATVNNFGRIDILINNAGMIQVGPVNVMTEHEYEQAMDIHFWAPLYTTLATLPHFREQKEGRIINIASIGGKIAVPHLLPYCASKFALVGLSEGLATELKKENILVSTITPSLMRTGSPRNITVRGNHEKEYAWFKTAASFPLLSEEPQNVARKIIAALETNKLRPSVSGAERLASITKELAPEVIDFVFAQVNRVLPNNGSDGFVTKSGLESESRLSANRIARGADSDAVLNNEM